MNNGAAIPRFMAPVFLTPNPFNFIILLSFMKADVVPIALKLLMSKEKLCVIIKPLLLFFDTAFESLSSLLSRGDSCEVFPPWAPFLLKKPNFFA